MQKLIYRHFQMKKKRGRVYKNQLEKTRASIEEHLNGLNPEQGDIHAFISEGSYYRDIHIWTRKGKRNVTWSLLWAPFKPESVKEILNFDTSYVLLGVDGAKTQSVYYLKSHDPSY